MKSKKFKLFWLKNNKKNLKISIILIAALLFIFVTAAGIRIFNLISNIEPEDGINFSNAHKDYDEDDADLEAIHEIHDASSIDDLIYKWATNNGEKMSSKNVVNVMLFGADSWGGETDNGRTDAMMLVSLNRKTKAITIVSFMRDSYTYMNIDGEDRFFKINAANGWGGPATVVKIIEDNYKIVIDNYVSVDFSTFPKIIDSLGGVTVDVQPYEARHIKDLFSISMKTGEDVLLDGQSALAFSRIRKCDADGDISRTRRQRAVILAIIESVKDASTMQVNSALDFIFPFVRTNYRKAEILNLGTQALMQKWADYDVIQLTSPSEENRASATIKTHFVWVVDYPLEAQALQKALYGKTNIIIDENRVGALNMLPKPIKPVSTTGAGKNNVNQGTTVASTTITGKDSADETTLIIDENTTGEATTVLNTETTKVETATQP
ncbi:MAG TPA: LCP family protein [Clostridia bacterium]|nr:LCP family protein [Clostridia bacterium]